MLQSTAGDGDPTLNDFLYCLITADIKRLSFCQTLHPKGNPQTEAGDGEPVSRGQNKLEEMRGQKQMRRDSHEQNRK